MAMPPMKEDCWMAMGVFARLSLECLVWLCGVGVGFGVMWCSEAVSLGGSMEGRF